MNNFTLKVRTSRLLLLMSLCVCGLLYYNHTVNNISDQIKAVNEQFGAELSLDIIRSYLLHKSVVEEYMKKRHILTTSKLGSILYKTIDYSQSNIKNSTFVVLIWKHWDWLKNRNVNYQHDSARFDQLDECSVSNCIFTGDDTLLNTADAVMIHLQQGEIPNVKKRNTRQRWIFFHDDTPLNTFSLGNRPPKLSDLANIFNWSMTYRSDADIPVPYGRTLPLPDPMFAELTYLGIAELVPNWERKRRDVLATVIMSNCHRKFRKIDLHELKRHIKVDIHGKCSDDMKLVYSCPDSLKTDCDIISEYLFYFASENAMCKQFVTEELFYYAYAKGAIPVIQGPPLEDCELLLPPNSYLHVDNYATAEDLARDIIRISEDDDRLLSYHVWRNNFEVTNEHGYFGSDSFHLCRICEALNYNDERRSVYDVTMLKRFLDPNESCLM